MIGQRPSPKIIDGKAYAQKLTATVVSEVAQLKSETGQTPGLAVVLVGDDPASSIYVKSKQRQTVAAGMASFEHRLGKETTEIELLGLVEQLNADPSVHGILVQLPLPAQIDPNSVLSAIEPDKDVDGFHVVNVGRLATGQDGLTPCTPLGCLILLKERLSDLAGLHAVIVGRSNIVGKPMAQLLLGGALHGDGRSLEEPQSRRTV